MGKIIYRVVMVALIIVFLVSGYMVIHTLVRGYREQAAFDTLSSLVDEDPAEDSIKITDEDSDETDENTEKSQKDLYTQTSDGKTILKKYAEVYEQNHDFYGWIKIDGTQVDYPVMYTPSDSQKYLRAAFDGSYAISGTPFIDGSCTDDGHLYLIYGHKMKNGTMFGDLSEYEDTDYLKEHKYIQFDTIYAKGTYEVVAAFYSEILSDDDPGFKYYEYTSLDNEETFNAFIDGVNSLTLYDTPVTGQFGEDFITLSTCSYHTTDGRFAVVAKKIEE